MKWKIALIAIFSVIQADASAVESEQSETYFDELQHNAEELQEYGPGFWVEDPTLVEPGHRETPSSVLSWEEAEQLEDELRPWYDFELLFRFSQTRWDECGANPSGNYYSIGCTSRRSISVILDDYLKDHLLSCVDEGLAAQGGGRARSAHLIHAGISGDRKHSPRSLHAENRAIDIKVIRVRLTNGSDRQFTFALSGNRPFYTALRKCWGEKVSRYNGCPLYSGQKMYTGSIGWEDKNHGSHMHLSVPYCINGRHGSGYYMR